MREKRQQVLVCSVAALAVNCTSMSPGQSVSAVLLHVNDLCIFVQVFCMPLLSWP